jgi:hypothetical protein
MSRTNLYDQPRDERAAATKTLLSIVTFIPSPHGLARCTYTADHAQTTKFSKPDDPNASAAVFS